MKFDISINSTIDTNIDEYIELYERLMEKTFKVLNIERDGPHPRKDYAKYKDIYPSIRFFYRDHYEEIVRASGIAFNPKFEKNLIHDILLESTSLFSCTDETSWFEGLKEIASKHSFAKDTKTFKANPNDYLGHVGDVAEMLRITFTGSRRSPNLYQTLHILGEHEMNSRIAFIASTLLK